MYKVMLRTVVNPFIISAGLEVKFSQKQSQSSWQWKEKDKMGVLERFSIHEEFHV